MIFNLPSVKVIQNGRGTKQFSSPQSLKADKVLIREIRDQGSVVVPQAIVTPQWLDNGEGHHPQQNVTEKALIRCGVNLR